MNRKKILVKGPVLTRSGYGEQARFALRALRSRPDLFDIFIQPIIWGQTSWLHEYDEERLWMDRKIEDTVHHINDGQAFDLSLQVTIPYEWEILAMENVGFTAGIETTKVPHSWLEKNNDNLNRLIVVSEHSKKVFEHTQFEGKNDATGEIIVLKNTTDIKVVNFPVREYDEIEALGLDLKHEINFITVTQWSPRKNLENTLKWFVEEFKDEEVGLVIKTNLVKNCVMDRDASHHKLRELLVPYPDRKCSVYLLHGDMSGEEIHSLYHHPKIKAMVSFTHGEGYGLPLFEAAYSGMPIVAPGWSGHLDFLVDQETGSNVFYNVEFDLQPVPPEVHWENVIIPESMWCYAREASAKYQMRQCYNDITAGNKELSKRCDKHAQNLKVSHAAENMYKAFVDGVLGCDSSTLTVMPDNTHEVLEFE